MLFASPAAGYDPTQTERAIRAALTLAGVAPTRLEIKAVQAIPPGAAGKRPLVMAHPAAATGPAHLAEHAPESGTAEPGDP